MDNYVSNLVDYLLDRLEKEKIIYCYGCYFDDNLNIVKDNNKPQKVSIVKKKTYINVYFFEDNVSYKYYYNIIQNNYDMGPYISNEYEDCVNHYNRYVYNKIKFLYEVKDLYYMNYIKYNEDEISKINNRCIEYKKFFINTDYLMEKLIRGE